MKREEKEKGISYWDWRKRRLKRRRGNKKEKRGGKGRKQGSERRGEEEDV